MICEKVLTYLVLGVFLSGTTARPESFDKPLQKKVLDLGRSKYLMPNDSQRVTLTCSYYPGFMVKQVSDPEYKGAFFIAIVPGQPEHVGACTHRPSPGERVFHDRGDWYFEGVKRDLVFLVAEGGDGASLFAAYDSRNWAKKFPRSGIRL